MDGGIFRLLRVVAQHRGAVEYDLRFRFRLGLRDVGHTVSIFEVARLMAIVQADPSSATAAAVEGWTHPISREALILMDIFDLDMAAATGGKGKQKPHPGRPFPQGKVTTGDRVGDPGTRTREDLVAHFRKLGHNLPV